MNAVDEMQDGTIVQLNPHTARNRMFAGCLMVVTELKSWGVLGYVQAFGEDGHPGEQAYYCAKWEEIEELAGGGYLCPFIAGPEEDRNEDTCEACRDDHPTLQGRIDDEGDRLFREGREDGLL